MILRGIVEEIISNTQVKVRMPTIDGAAGASTSVETENLNVATISTPSGVYPNLVVGDNVFIGFETNSYSLPIILGKIFTDDDLTKYNNKPDIIVANLTAVQTANLPANTNIGDVSYQDLTFLAGLKDSVQEQFNLIDLQLQKLTDLLNIAERTPELQIENFTGNYDGEYHTFNAYTKDATLSYSEDPIEETRIYSDTKPQYKQAGIHISYVKASNGFGKSTVKEAVVTIIGKLLTVNWGITQFEYDGTKKYPIPVLNGILGSDDVQVDEVKYFSISGMELSEPPSEKGVYRALIHSLKGANALEYQLDETTKTTIFSIGEVTYFEWGGYSNTEVIYNGNPQTITLISNR